MKKMINTSELKNEIGVFYIPTYTVTDDDKKDVNFYLTEYFLNDESVQELSIHYTLQNAKKEIVKKFYQDYPILKEFHSQFIIQPKTGLIDTIKKGLFKPTEIENLSDLHKRQLENLEYAKELIDNEDIYLYKLKNSYNETNNNDSDLINHESLYVIDTRVPTQPKFEATTVKKFYIRIKDDEISYIVKPLLFEIETIPMEDLIQDSGVWISKDKDYFVYTDIEKAYEFAIEILSNIKCNNMKEHQSIMKLASKIDQIFV